MRDQALFGLLNTSNIQLSNARDDNPQVQRLQCPLLTRYLGRWGEAFDINHSSRTIHKSYRSKLPESARLSHD
jgi:hypothetical protein